MRTVEEIQKDLKKYKDIHFEKQQEEQKIAKILFDLVYELQKAEYMERIATTKEN